jgi:hypothetical protein
MLGPMVELGQVRLQRHQFGVHAELLGDGNCFGHTGLCLEELTTHEIPQRGYPQRVRDQHQCARSPAPVQQVPHHLRGRLVLGQHQAAESGNEAVHVVQGVGVRGVA